MCFHWYRSRFFWFGYVGLVMLLVGWFSFPASSLDLWYTTAGTPGPRTNQITYAASKDTGYLGFHRADHDASGLGERRTPGWGTLSYPLAGNERGAILGQVCLFPKMNFVKGISVANWSIVTVYLFIWLGGLILWQRRKRRLMKGAGLSWE